MALVLIAQDNEYINWNRLNEKSFGVQSGEPWLYKNHADGDIYIFNPKNVNLYGPAFWETLVKNIPNDIYVYIHFGSGGTGDDKLLKIEETVKLCKGSNRIKHLSYYSIGKDKVGDPSGIADIYKKSENESEFDSVKLIEIFKEKGFVEKKIHQTKEIENQQLHIAALLLLLKVNQKSMKAASDLLSNLKKYLSAMKQGGIDTTNLVSYLDSKPLNDLLPEADMREMEEECRKILHMLEGEKPSLETDNQHAN